MKQNTTLIQCKYWNKPIPPGEMRAFKASCDEEQSEYKKVKNIYDF